MDTTMKNKCMANVVLSCFADGVDKKDNVSRLYKNDNCSINVYRQLSGKYFTNRLSDDAGCPRNRMTLFCC